MTRNYGQPTYTGLDIINELKALAKGRGGEHPRPTMISSKVKLDFNASGYADVMSKGVRNLIIDFDEYGNLSAYSPAGTYVYRKLTSFSDPERAAAIIEALYNNPYYHSTNLYKVRLQRLRASIELYSYKSLTDLKYALKNLYDECKIIEAAIKLGTRTFGCQHRFLTINHACVNNMNLYLANFENTILRLGKVEKLIYNGLDTGDTTRSYTEHPYSLKDLVIDNSDIFGPQIDMLGNCPLIESKVLSELNLALVEPPSNIKDLIRTVIWFMEMRKVFTTTEQLNAFSSKVLDESLTPHQRKDIFNVMFVKAMYDAGYKVLQHN